MELCDGISSLHGIHGRIWNQKFKTMGKLTNPESDFEKGWSMASDFWKMDESVFEVRLRKKSKISNLEADSRKRRTWGIKF